MGDAMYNKRKKINDVKERRRKPMNV